MIASRTSWREADCGRAPKRPRWKRSRVAVRRSLPLEVFGTLPAGTSRICSGGASSSRAAVSPIRCRSTASASASVSLRFRHHDKLLGAGTRVGRSEDGDAALANALEIADRRLDLLRIDMATSADDDVLRPTGDEDVAAGGIGEVAAVQPRAIEQLSGLFGVVEIARGRRGSTELKPALLSFADLAGRIDDADLMTGQWPAARNELQGVGHPRRRPGGAAMPDQFAAIDPVDDRRPAERREGEADGILGKAVDRAHRLRTKAVGREPRGEASDRLRGHRFRPVGDHAHRPEVEAGDHRVLDAAQAELEGEVGRGGQRRPMPVDRPKPRLGPHEEGKRRHHDQRNREVQAAQPRADQAHVVVERQPTHEDV